MPTAAENLRGRFNPEWRTRIDLAGLDKMLENALTFIEAPQAMKAEIEAPHTLNAHGVSEALRTKLSKNVVPELARICHVINERKAALKAERDALGAPKVDPTDLVQAQLRGEARSFLRSLDATARLALLMQNPVDAMLLAAALEAPMLAGLTPGMRMDIERNFVRAHHAQTLRLMEDRQEALDVVGAAAQIAIMQVRNYVGMTPNEFDQWFLIAGGKALAAE